jgi:hypothetical protein
MNRIKSIVNTLLGVVLIVGLCCITGENDLGTNLMLFGACLLIACYLLARQKPIYVNGVKIRRIR